MKTIQTTVAVIGAGTAGLAAYRAAKALGASAVIIEGKVYGTTCARVGCMPSKLLIAAAESAHNIQKAPMFGIHLDGKITIDGHQVMKRVREERDRFVGFVVDSVEKLPQADKLYGMARFIDDKTLQVGEDILVKAQRFVIATGSSPAIPNTFLALQDRVIVNDELFSWDTLPESVAVFGLGVIGLELGLALAFLGVRVRMFGMGGGIGPLSDPAIREKAYQAFSQSVYLDPDAQVLSMEKKGDKAHIQFIDNQGKTQTDVFDYVLAATGRIPNVRNLGLENTGLKLNERGMPAFNLNTLQCGDSPIFIAGDANNYLPLLHEAADEGKIAGENAVYYPHVQPGKRRSMISIVFSYPQIMLVGVRFQDLEPEQYVVGEVSFDDQGRSRVMGVNEGLLHVYAQKGTKRLLGAEMVGPQAEHLAHLLAWSHQQQMTIPQMLSMPFYHPVIEEGLRTALRDANRQLGH